MRLSFEKKCCIVIPVEKENKRDRWIEKQMIWWKADFKLTQEAP